jgi:hypothetical protein
VVTYALETAYVSLSTANSYHVKPVPTTRALPDANAFVQGYDLTEQEAAAVLKVDVRALYTMGVHSLLLRPFTLLNKVSNEDYARSLKGLE